MDTANSTRRVALITGPTAGLGQGIALELAKKGYQLVLLGRSLEKLQAVARQCTELGAPEPKLLVCDMASQKQVRKAADAFIASGLPLHVLVNNAGLVNRGRRLTEDGLESTIAVAYWSAFLLTMLLLPRMRDSAPATIINTSSDTYPFGKIPFDDPTLKNRYFFLASYASAKMAQMQFTFRLARLLAPYRIGVNIYNPGPIYTTITSREKGVEGKIADFLFRQVSKPVAEGIKAPVQLATANNLGQTTGKFYSYNVESPVKPAALDWFSSEALWLLSEELTGYPVPDFLTSNTTPKTDGEIRIGVMGAARIAPYSFFPKIREVPGLKVVALAEEYQPLSALLEYAKKHLAPVSDQPKLYRSFEKMLADPDIDAVYIPLPTSLHTRWAVAAIQAGKHVLCEKPFAANAEDAAQIHDAASRHEKLVIAEAMHFRYHPLADRVREIIQSGEIGKVTRIEANASALFYVKNDFRFQYEMAGGTTLDFGCYPIGFVRHILGTEPEVLQAKATETTPLCDGIMEAEMQFPGEIRASFFIAFRSWRKPLDISIRIQGTEGEISILNFIKPEVYHRLVIRNAKGKRREKVPGESTYAAQLKAFAAAIRGEKPMVTSSDDAVKNLKVIDAIYQKAGLPLRGKHNTNHSSSSTANKKGEPHES